MPGLVSHLAFVDRLSADPSLTPTLSHGARKALGSQEAALGALGPDPLFFLLRELPLGEVVRAYLQVEERLEDIRALFSKVKAILDVPNPIDIYTEDVQAELAGSIGAVKGTIASGIFNQVLRIVDLFELMKPSPQRGFAPPEWFWIEILHNLQTGRFAAALKDQATSLERKSFYMGYLSHFALDSVGHPWVNLLSGGPYRNQWRRHVLIEKWLDVHTLDRIDGRELAGSMVYRQIEIGSAPPEDLCEYFASALSDTYSGLRWLPGPSEIDECFRLTYRFLKGQTSGGLLNLPPLEPFDVFKLDDKVRRILEWNPPALGGTPSGSSASAQDWLKFLDELWEFAKYCMEKALRIVLLPLDVLGELPLAAVRFVIWNLTRLVMETYEKLRLALALSAHVHPWRSQVPHLQSLVDSGSAPAFRAAGGPYERVPASADQSYHLVHPRDAGVQIETPPAYALAPRELPGFMEVMFSSHAEGRWWANKLLTQPMRSPSDEGRFLEFQASAAEVFDEAYRLTVDADTPLANIDLDGDRSFAWPEWEPLHPEPWNDLSFAFKP